MKITSELQAELNSKLSRIPYVIKGTYDGMLYIKVVIILYILYFRYNRTFLIYRYVRFFIIIYSCIRKEKFLCIKKLN